MEPFNCPKTFIITDNVRVKLANVQLDTLLVIESVKRKDQDLIVDNYITMNIDRWTEFKKNINAIDEEFKKRFNYQYNDC